MVENGYYGTLIGNPIPGIQWYKFRPHAVTPNWGMGPPVRRFLSNYFDFLLNNPHHVLLKRTKNLAFDTKYLTT